jgi:hypothetical protein
MKPIHAILSMTCMYAPLRVAPGRLFLLFWLALLGVGSLSYAENRPAAPPVIVLSGTALTGTVNDTVRLDASATTGQGVLTYAWSIKTAPNSSTATIVGATAPKTALIPDKPGTYLVGLTVTDTAGQKATADLTVRVALPGRPPVITVVAPTTVGTGRRAFLDASQSGDAEGDKLTYAWVIKTKPAASTAVLTSPQAATTGFFADVVGTYILSLTVSDGVWPAVSDDDVSVVVVVPLFRFIDGSWTAATGSSGGSDYTPRNKFYSFDVATDNQPVSLTLTSPDVNVGISLYDPLGNRLLTRGTGRSVVLDRTVNAGTYTVMVSTVRRYDVGTFRLAGRGLASEFTPLPADRALAANVSFGAEGGGGGIGNRFPISPRNHYYTFEVTEDNTVTDINVAPAGISLWLNLRSPAGAEADYTFGLLAAGAPRYFIPKLNKGTYGLYVGTGKRDDIGTYTLEVFGKVKNLKQSEINSTNQTDSYVGRNAAITYNLTVTENNSTLDASISSPDIAGTLEILNPNGSRLAYTVVASKYDYVVSAVSKGVYKVIIKPGLGTSGIGKYTVSVYGKFSELKKQ